MKIIMPDKAAQYILTALTVLLSGILTVLSWYFIPLLTKPTAFYYKLMLFSCALFVTLGIFVAGVYLPCWFAHLQYNVTDSHITKRSGAFYITERTVRFSSVQYTDTMRFPLTKSLGLGFVMLHVLGGGMLLMFLKEKDIQEILFYC